MPEAVLDTKSKSRTQRPKRYAVILLNDDFTTMEFVVIVLATIFNHDMDRANAIMLDIHKKGKGVAGIYSHEVAETKAAAVEELARRHEFPLKADVVPEDGA